MGGSRRRRRRRRGRAVRKVRTEVEGEYALMQMNVEGGRGGEGGKWEAEISCLGKKEEEEEEEEAEEEETEEAAEEEEKEEAEEEAGRQAW